MKQLLFLISLTILGSSCADQNAGQETVFCDNVTHRGTVYFNNNLGCWGKYIEWASGKRGFICNEEFID